MRDYSLDIMRILACLMIVTMHSPLPGSVDDGIFLSSLSYLTAPGVGLFFMISGALLLPVKSDTKSFLKRRFTKVAIPTLIWTLFYILIDTFAHDQGFDLRSVLSMFFSAQGAPVFWFLYTLAGLYLLAPVISRWLVSVSRRELEFYLLLWCISLCYPLIGLVLDINTSVTGILYYFTGYVGYFLSGYYLRIYGDHVRFRWLLPALLVAYIVPAVCKIKAIPVDFYSIFWYLSVFVVIQCVFIWKVVTWLVPDKGWPKINHILTGLSSLTFGVYLVHFFVIRYCLWGCPFIKGIAFYPLQVFVIALLAFLFSVGISFILGLLPIGKFLIGANLRRHV